MTDELEPTSTNLPIATNGTTRPEPPEGWVRPGVLPGPSDPVTPVEPAEGWVSEEPGPTERAPGIDDVHETTYVDPGGHSQRWQVLVGTGLALAGIAAFVVLVFVARARSNEHHTKDASAGVTRTSEPVTSTSTTPDPSTITATGAGAGSGTTATTAAPPATTATTAAPAAAAAPPATPPATADPAQAPYVPVAVPAGVTATMSACSWSPGNGGQLQASGTITGVHEKLAGWTVTMHWLQNSRQLAQQSALVFLAPGESKPWNLTISAPAPPADLTCALEIA